MTVSKVGEIWQFESEFKLEEWLWYHLSELLNLQPFKRQFSVKGQICDILAIDGCKQLTIIELKNVEDRYVVPQLTRYYDALRKEQPFGTEVDWNQPIRLMAIAPSFHADNEIDCNYNTLDIELVGFELMEVNDELHFRLMTHKAEVFTSIPILIEQRTPTVEIPIVEPPRKLLNWLSHSSEAESQKIMGIREQILGFHEHMKEVSESQSLLYKGKGKPCAELRRKKIGESQWLPTLFLWLPSLDRSPRTFRMMIWLDDSWEVVAKIIHSPKGFKARRVWGAPYYLNALRIHSDEMHWQYERIMPSDGKSCILPKLVDLTLQHWQSRA